MFNRQFEDEHTNIMGDVFVLLPCQLSILKWIGLIFNSSIKITASLKLISKCQQDATLMSP